jgi:signal transduction histidine kinase
MLRASGRESSRLDAKMSTFMNCCVATCDICLTECTAKGLTLQFALEAAEYRIHGDPTRLKQVFWNLIKNAIKFSAPRGQISVRSSNPSRNWIRLEVIDGGIGIASEALPKIFDPFEQAVSTDSGGLGLGLAISKAIVESHKGRISAFSAGKDRGAKLVIELPMTP